MAQHTKQQASCDANCINCGYLLKVPDIESRCSECGHPIRDSVDRHGVAMRLKNDALRAAVIGLLAALIFPPLAPVAICLGVRSLRSALTQRVSRFAILMSASGIALGLLGLVSLYIVIDLIVMMVSGV